MAEQREKWKQGCGGGALWGRQTGWTLGQEGGGSSRRWPPILNSEVGLDPEVEEETQLLVRET